MSNLEPHWIMNVVEFDLLFHKATNINDKINLIIRQAYWQAHFGPETKENQQHDCWQIGTDEGVGKSYRQ